MGIVNRILRNLDSEEVTLYGYNDTTGDKEVVATILCSIQGSGSENRVKGIMADPTNEGDMIREVQLLITTYPIKQFQRLERIEEDNTIYEIRDVEHNGRDMNMGHYKGYIVRVDNQR